MIKMRQPTPNDLLMVLDQTKANTPSELNSLWVLL